MNPASHSDRPNPSWGQADSASTSSRLQVAFDDATIPSAGPDLLIALDVDGTLIANFNELSPRVARAIHNHLEAGTHIVLSTGRPVIEAQLALQQLGIDAGFAVVTNGALVLTINHSFDERHNTQVPSVNRAPEPDLFTFSQHTFNPHTTITMLEERFERVEFAAESLHNKLRITPGFPDGALLAQAEVVSKHEMMNDDDLLRLVACAPDVSPGHFFPMVEQMNLTDAEATPGFNGWIDFAPAAVSKATGLAEVCEALGIPTAHTVAIGDSRNDVEMLRWAGVGIAMKTGRKHVESVASVVTDPIERDGAALALELLL
ncbi:MAG: HAD-IIB family hydrolase [Actinomycetaceae bacterium]|nr:HAD-IIB family hydrolase [Arcanobacterium sp.]MDD7505092.1 HAD-IIB family hydrolase [Actinomycetaceae bacterium]MDY6142609.1 HAD-IIB family hydrolase [Arcanobacterium sp.]